MDIHKLHTGKQFDNHERTTLDSNEPSESFDISLIYKLLQCICDLPNTNDSKWNNPGTLENYLKQMKNYRNILAHEELYFTFKQLQEKIVLLEELCRNGLVAAGLRSRRHIVTDVASMEKNMEEVLLGGIDLWEPYRDALKALRNEQCAVLVRQGREDIRKLAKKLKILNPFSWLLDNKFSHLNVKHIFTKLSMHGNNEIDMEDLLITTSSSGDLPDCVIITGGPGIGKSSLTRFLVHDWLSFHPIMLGLENVDLVLPVELRYVTSNNMKDMIKEEVLPSVSNHLQNDDILTAFNNISVVWVLDGFDEATVQTKGVIKELLRKSPNARILITTRTECKPEIESFLNNINCQYLSVEIKGFTRDAIEKYAKKVIDVSIKNSFERAETLKGFMKFCIKENPLSWGIFTVPLFLMIALILWLDNPVQMSSIKSMSALYTILVDHIISKLVSRDSFSTLGERKPSLMKKCNIFLDYLGFILWKDEYSYQLSEREVELLEDKCKELGIPFKDTMSAFFVFNEKETTDGYTEEYTIIHRTVREFLSARAFCNHMISENWDIMTTAGDWFRKMREAKLFNKNDVTSRNKYNLDHLEMEKPQYDVRKNSRELLELKNNYFFGIEWKIHPVTVKHVLRKIKITKKFILEM